MLEIILITFLSYRNGVLAKQKGQNQWMWLFITLATSFITGAIGTMIVMLFFLGNSVDWARVSSSPQYFDTVQKQLQTAFMSNPLHELAIYAFSVGGYLLMRYILERMPDKKEPTQKKDVNWMDEYHPTKEQ